MQIQKIFGTGKKSDTDIDIDTKPPMNICVSDLVKRIGNGSIKNIVCMVGAGISVSCGIPDFRSKNTGLYHNLQKYNLPYAEAIFDLQYFKKTEGEAFYALSKEIWPDNFHPSPSHAFIRLLHDKEMLRRCFTQNIDTLERRAGIPEGKLVEAHGSFGTASCISCHTAYDSQVAESCIKAGKTPIKCESCQGLVKPDIVFFGEDLPKKFFDLRKSDLKNCDLLIIMGTSLKVHPFAGLVDFVRDTTPRLLLNNEVVGVSESNTGKVGLRLRKVDNYRDYMIEGNCDDAVRAICDSLNWRNDLETLMEKFNPPKVDHTPINLAVCFKGMKGGFDYNWQISAKLSKLSDSKTKSGVIEINGGGKSDNFSKMLEKKKSNSAATLKMKKKQRRRQKLREIEEKMEKMKL